MNIAAMPRGEDIAGPVNRLSEHGADFIARHEGFASKAYRDASPAGVWTIGTGFTWGSRVFRDYWLKTRGHKLHAGDRITREENARILIAAANGEYGAAVARHIAPRKQHEFDGATSACFNLGPDAAKWDWGRALAAGDPARAARLLEKYSRSGGRRLRGLVRRRLEEGRLIRDGDYGPAHSGHPRGVVAATPPRNRDLVRGYQEKLERLGYPVGPAGADGLYGKATRAAVRRFQGDHPHLVEDGVLGRATMAQIDRSADRRDKPKAFGLPIAAAGAVATGAVAVTTPQWLWWTAAGAAVAVVGALVWFAWKYRGDL